VQCGRMQCGRVQCEKGTGMGQLTLSRAMD
jgi:hypothetical protein